MLLEYFIYNLKYFRFKFFVRNSLSEKLLSSPRVEEKSYLIIYTCLRTYDEFVKLKTLWIPYKTYTNKAFLKKKPITKS